MSALTEVWFYVDRQIVADLERSGWYVTRTELLPGFKLRAWHKKHGTVHGQTVREVYDAISRRLSAQAELRFW